MREAFTARGHDAWSFDLLPSEKPGLHFEADILWHKHGCNALNEWDMMIAFPPCTHLAVSGARYFAAKRVDGRQQAAVDFFRVLANAPIERIAIENPIGIMSTKWRKPDQIIQPWQFGHGETKATCLWLKGLPKLVPTNVVAGRDQRIWKMGPSPTRAQDRSRTYSGIAAAMAERWG